VIYRRGRWAKGALASVGFVKNELSYTRIGLRTARGMKGAPQRNRVKRRLRALLFSEHIPLQTGLDVVVVAAAPAMAVKKLTSLEQELLTLCHRLQICT